MTDAARRLQHAGGARRACFPPARPRPRQGAPLALPAPGLRFCGGRYTGFRVGGHRLRQAHDARGDFVQPFAKAAVLLAVASIRRRRPGGVRCSRHGARRGRSSSADSFDAISSFSNSVAAIAFRKLSPSAITLASWRCVSAAASACAFVNAVSSAAAKLGLLRRLVAELAGQFGEFRHPLGKLAADPHALGPDGVEFGGHRRPGRRSVAIAVSRTLISPDRQSSSPAPRARP